MNSRRMSTFICESGCELSACSVMVGNSTKTRITVVGKKLVNSYNKRVGDNISGGGKTSKGQGGMDHGGFGGAGGGSAGGGGGGGGGGGIGGFSQVRDPGSCLFTNTSFLSNA